MTLRTYNDLCSKLGTHDLHAVRGGRAARLVEVAPAAVLVALALALAWVEQGSVLAKHWLGYALVAPLLLATLALAGSLRRPPLAARIAVGALLALAAVAALSAFWSPVPALARDEALLTALYAVVLAVTATTLRTAEGRIAALAVLTAGFAALAVATAVSLRYGDGQIDAYRGTSGRLYFPVSYVNAEAATMLIAFWPAIVLAARRRGHAVLRALSLGAAAAMLAGALLTQSRGAAVALAGSAVVVLALAPSRLRFVLPLLIAVAPTVVGFGTLTAPFGVRLESDAVYTDAIRSAAGVVLLAGAAGCAAGLLYALLDRAVTLPERALRGIRAVAAAAVVVAAGVGVAALVQLDDPAGRVQDRWEAFKQEPEKDEGGSHFENPGSNRYDFWRVAVGELRDHPLAGAGARSYGTAYLREGHTGETPVRAHSLPLDVLAENGAVGFLLLAVALGAALVPAVRRRATASGAALLGGGSYWVLHAAGDWTWTFPVSGIPFFLLCGIAAAAPAPAALSRRVSLAAAAGGVALALVFVPPWLAGRYTDLALVKGLPEGSGDLARAKRLDPLSTEPYLVEAVLAPERADAVRALEQAAELEPESARIAYQLGLALLATGRREEARAELERARELYPRNPAIAEALRSAG